MTRIATIDPSKRKMICAHGHVSQQVGKQGPAYCPHCDTAHKRYQRKKYAAGGKAKEVRVQRALKHYHNAAGSAKKNALARAAQDRRELHDRYVIGLMARRNAYGLTRKQLWLPENYLLVEAHRNKVIRDRAARAEKKAKGSSK